MTNALLKTPLYDAHVARKARMVEFAGWSMPISYTGIQEEHRHTREACSLFDVSHMGRLRIAGGDADALLERLCTRDLSQPEAGRCYYTHICKEDGGILDDVIASKTTDGWMVVCNASNRDKIVAWIEKHAAGRDVKLADETLKTAMVALQGPKTMDVARSLVDEDLSAIKRYRFKELPLLIAKIGVYRTGYTGEDGFELVLPGNLVSMLLPQVLGRVEKPHDIVRPAGLGARDTLRLEAGMPLYGHELTEDVDSLTAGQSWCVHLEKDFIGAETMRKIKEQGIPRRLVGIELEGRRIARQHARILQGDKAVGEVTSGTLSPTLGKSIAMGFVPNESAEVGTELSIDLGRTQAAAKVVPLPFYKRPK